MLTLSKSSIHLPGQLKPAHRGPLSSQGGSGLAPSSTILQEELSMFLDLCYIHMIVVQSWAFWGYIET